MTQGNCSRMAIITFLTLLFSSQPPGSSPSASLAPPPLGGGRLVPHARPQAARGAGQPRRLPLGKWLVPGHPSGSSSASCAGLPVCSTCS